MDEDEDKDKDVDEDKDEDGDIIDVSAVVIRWRCR